MSGIGNIGAAGGIDRVMALRAQILERNQALQRATAGSIGNPAATTAAPASGTSFASTLEQVLNDVNQSQAKAGDISSAYERGENVDIAKVMLARQEASVAFEATLQVRNKLLSAYKDIMSMPV